METTINNAESSELLITREEIVGKPSTNPFNSVVERPLPFFEKIYNVGWVRKTFIIVMLAIIWQITAGTINNDLIFPNLTDTLQSLWKNMLNGVLFERIWVSLRVLCSGYAIGIGLAAVLTVISVNSKLGTDFLETATAMFNPVPAIALLPLAMIWFGLGEGAILFILCHSVLWAVALNTHSGFLSVSSTLRMVGRNYELGGLRFTFYILIPAAFPHILTGLKVAWAFAWRSLIAAELVFGVSSGSGGLGWFIFENKNSLEIPTVFAGLFCVILIGLFMENVIFRSIEVRTIRKWGMQIY